MTTDTIENKNEQTAVRKMAGSVLNSASVLLLKNNLKSAE
ncbi:hypothetical protein CLU83_0824 [Flavobacterium sp. 1]|nr:hypothetical protein CLU83_0824 [Flavobacterium sp. 1]